MLLYHESVLRRPTPPLPGRSRTDCLRDVSAHFAFPAVDEFVHYVRCVWESDVAVCLV
jgi:hypothetical protein